jgi:Ca-activated chloride channel family protein
MRTLLLGALALMSSITPLAAQGWIEIERSQVPGNQNPAVIRTSSEVHTIIEGRVARVEVEEQFRNSGGGLAEGHYLYPLPGEAVFQNFSLWMGQQELRGEMMNAEQARGIYEEIVRRKKDPALLTLAGHGLVRAQVFPIQPGETRKVVLRYTLLLDRVGDALRLRYALGTRGGESGEWRLTLPGGDGFGVPYSPTHPIRSVGRAGDIVIDTRSGGDIELFLPLRRGLVGTSVLTHAVSNEDGYLMLLLSPSAVEEGAVVPRDLTLVVDVSGSMSGAKMDQARAALHQALGTLRAADRFRLIAFSSGVREFRPGFALATGPNLAAAREFIDGLAADGGTNISGALETALGSTVAEERLPLVIFLTDGIPSVGEQQPDRIAAAAAGRIGRARIFTVGVGHDVNTYLLDRLAKEGHGSAEYVAPGADVEVAVGQLMNKLRRPALVNLRIAESPVRLHDMSPAQLPDLFFGEELVVFGRYSGTGRGPVVIEGERNGRRERFTATVAFPASESGNTFVPRLWASRRIGELTRQVRLEGPNEDLIREIRDLGLRHGILTEYTSYLVQEPDQLAARDLRLGGVSRDDIAANRPQAAAPAAQTGQRAFEQARQSARLAKTSTVAEADAAMEEKLEGSGGRTDRVKRAGGRVFRLNEGVWTDIAHRDSVQLVTVTPFSPAYFALTRALPELGQSLAVGDQVLVAGRQVSIRVAAGGRDQLSDTELKRIVTAFRGAA